MCGLFPGKCKCMTTPPSLCVSLSASVSLCLSLSLSLSHTHTHTHTQTHTHTHTRTTRSTCTHTIHVSNIVNMNYILYTSANACKCLLAGEFTMDFFNWSNFHTKGITWLQGPLCSACVCETVISTSLFLQRETVILTSLPPHSNTFICLPPVWDSDTDISPRSHKQHYLSSFCVRQWCVCGCETVIATSLPDHSTSIISLPSVPDSDVCVSRQWYWHLSQITALALSLFLLCQTVMCVCLDSDTDISPWSQH